MDERPILFFDSGIGGLSVLAPARKLMPAAPVIYVADNGGFPYGVRTEAEIAARVPALPSFIHGTTTACDPATVETLAQLRSVWRLGS